MLDFNHILSTPGYDVWYFQGGSGPSNYQWKTWTKPRGVSWIYALVVGAGGGGGTGRNTSTSSGGGGGGGSGAQASLLIPAMFFPDTVSVQCPSGGLGATTNSTAGTNGTYSTVINLEGGTSLGTNFQILTAGPGLGGGAGAAAGGSAGTAGSASSIATCNLASKGHYTFIAGQAGTAGSTGNATAVSVPTTGLMVTGGGGGGGGGAGSGAGAGIAAFTGLLGEDIFPLPTSGGTAAVTSTPAGRGDDGFSCRNLLLNIGGAGGGGASTTLGGICGQGGDGAPGCGGGGAGGATTTATTIARGGNGGPGFAYIISW